MDNGLRRLNSGSHEELETEEDEHVFASTSVKEKPVSH